MFKMLNLLTLILGTIFTAIAIATVPPEVIAKYETNLIQAKAGTPPIFGTLGKVSDIAAKDPSLAKAVEIMAAYFKEKDFAAFLDATNAKAIKSKTASFRSVAKLGEGGFGKVFHVELSITNKNSTDKFDIAVKAPKNMPKEPRQIYLMEVELNNMRVANHMANMLPYYGAMTDKSGKAFILTKKLDTSLLDKIEKRASLDDSFFHHFIMRMSAAMNDLAEASLVHNDIKLDNIMLDADGNYYLIDFGEARLLPSSDMRNYNVRVDALGKRTGDRILNYGTDAYKAPEKVVDDKYVTGEVDWKKSDAYSMGLTLASLILAKEPNTVWSECSAQNICTLPKIGLEAINFEQLKNFIAQQFTRISNPSKIKRAAMKLALKLISVRPSERPSSMEAEYKALLKQEQ